MLKKIEPQPLHWKAGDAEPEMGKAYKLLGVPRWGSVYLDQHGMMWVEWSTAPSMETRPVYLTGSDAPDGDGWYWREG